MANISTTVVTDSAGALVPDGPGLQVEGRTELKYSVPGPVADAALHVARAYLLPDVFALGPTQAITSLYLDTPHFTFLRWHRERLVNRFKLRIRRYGDDPAATLYAEVKRKTGSVVRKHRAPFPADALHAVLTEEGQGRYSAHIQEFVRHRSRCCAVPTMLVACVRESLRDARDGTAVTVDRNLRHQPTCRADLVGRADAWRSIPLPGASGAATTLVELKYRLEPEPWMASLIEQLAPWRVSFSKYAAAMAASAPAGC